MISLYLHIPFCEVKCGYCDFFSLPRGYKDFDLQKEYVEALVHEIRVRSEAFAGRRIKSIFFGGGTPSLLAPPLMEKILLALQKFYHWDSKTEVTMETNPRTVSLEKLKAFRRLGINRISIGVQSFQDRFLKAMGRIHSGSEAKKTVKEARKAGFENLSIDMIFALPGQSFEDWKMDLEEALSLETPHLSAYHLTIEEGTSFERMYRAGKLKLPTEEEGLRCLEWTRERLSKAHLIPYEISNFARKGYESIHNSHYWQYGEYLGFGTAAASFIKEKKDQSFLRGYRRSNIKDLRKYLAAEWDGESETIGLKMAMGEYVMLSLRTRQGVSEAKFKKEFGADFLETFVKQSEKWKERGWLEKVDKSWQLTKAGLIFSDEVMASFLSIKERE